MAGTTEVPFSVKFTAKQLEKVARLAELEDRSRASVIRRAVDQIEAPTTETKPAEKR
jgi:hypothetical protein